jgi:hypothetical protein
VLKGVDHPFRLGIREGTALPHQQRNR